MPLARWIDPRPQGLYLPLVDAWIDPATPQPRALITHGHADHARGGHRAVLATAETLAIMAARYGPQAGQPQPYGARID
ncbi:MAG: DNA ligase-associated DEXH box helicase, partial [Sphingomonas sp.]|nr:DNA ligase-associated DEXH box helicase [Sphingomonas sp.]